MIIMLVLQAAIVFVPFLNKILFTAPLDLKDWLILAAFIPTLFVADEIRKLFARIFSKRKSLKAGLSVQ
jgi:magnesium-transporting ATPase (P-type)